MPETERKAVINLLSFTLSHGCRCPNRRNKQTNQQTNKQTKENEKC